MGQARVCDKCKRILQCAPDTKIKIYVHYFGELYYELCSNCTEELRTWLDSNNSLNTKEN